jgi:hypothetical protein
MSDDLGDGEGDRPDKSAIRGLRGVTGIGGVGARGCIVSGRDDIGEADGSGRDGTLGVVDGGASGTVLERLSPRKGLFVTTCSLNRPCSPRDCRLLKPKGLFSSSFVAAREGVGILLGLTSARSLNGELDTKALFRT